MTLRFWYLGVLALPLVAARAAAQCPDGTPPPCAGERRPPTPQPATARAIYRQITSSGRATSPALTQNGLFLAFVDGGRLYVRSLAAGGSAIPVVSEAEASRWGTLHKVEWSTDGARLFVYTDSGTYALPALGGTAQRVTQWGGGRFTSMSPGGDRVAEWHSGGLVRVRDVTSGAIDTVPVPGDYKWLLSVAWSPQANALVVQTTDAQRRYTMRLLDLRRRVGRVLLEDSVSMSLIAWNGAPGAIYYVRWVYPIQLWKLSVSAAAGAASGRPAMVIPMLDGYEFSTADDGTLAFARDAGTSNIWIGSVQGDTARRWLTTGTTSSFRPRFSPDGQWVAFVREDGASANLFVTGTDSGAPEQLTFLNDRVGHFAWSPNGERIAFCHEAGDAPPSIGIVLAAGGPVVRPTTSRISSDSCGVGWLSPDEVLYHQAGNRNFGVVSLRGGPARRLVANDSVGWMFYVETDPAGRFVALMWNRWRFGGAGIWLVSLADSSQRLLYPGFSVGPLRWLATGDVLYARERTSPFRLLRIPIALPDSTTTVPLLNPCPDGVDDVNSDGSRIVCAERTSVSDIWLIRDFDPTRRRRP